MPDLTRIERAAWAATGHDQASWAAVRRALAAVGPLIAAQTAEQLWLAADETARRFDGRTVAGRAAREVAQTVAVNERDFYTAAAALAQREASYAPA